MALATAAEYKAYTGDATADSIVTSALGFAQSMMDTYCNRVFEQATYTDVGYDGTGRGKIVLPNTPVTAVTAVKVRTGTSTTTTLATTEYRFDSATGILYRETGGYSTGGACWPLGFKNILVTYTGGYASGSVPANITHALYTITSALLGMRGTDPTLISESDGLYQYQRAASEIERSALVHAVLGPLRRPVA